MRGRAISFCIATAFLVCFVSAFPALAKKKPPAKPVNINTANSAELQQVPGIGPATAEKILQMRKSYGAFKSVNDLLSIRGLGPKRLEKMRKYLTVGKAPSQGKPVSGTKPASALRQSLQARKSLQQLLLILLVSRCSSLLRNAQKQIPRYACLRQAGSE
jgi:competence ComEA-like helix-hairpin-helix protein